MQRYRDTPLHLSARGGFCNITQLLIESECNINVGSRDDKTPLHIAVEENDETLVKLFLKNNADVNIADRCGDAPLDVCARRDFTNITQLIESGCYISLLENDAQGSIYTKKILYCTNLLGLRVLARQREQYLPNLKKVMPHCAVLLGLRVLARWREKNLIHYASRGAGMAQWLSTRLPPMWPGFDSRTRHHTWVEFVVGSRPCSEGFSPGTPVFLPPQKQTFLNSNSTWKQWSKSHSVDSTVIPIYLLIYLLLV